MYKVNCTVLYERNCTGGLTVINVITKRVKGSVVTWDFMQGRHYDNVSECDKDVRAMLKQNHLYVGSNPASVGYWSDIMYITPLGSADTFLIQ